MPVPENRSKRELAAELDDLRIRLAEAEDTLRAIRKGEVDAVIVTGLHGDQVFSLTGTEAIYRLIVETMKVAAFTLSFDGKILYCNSQFGELVKQPPERLPGTPLVELVAEQAAASLPAFLTLAQKEQVNRRLVFRAGDGTPVSSYISTNILSQFDNLAICAVADDIAKLEKYSEFIARLRGQREALRVSQDRLQAIFDNSPDAMFATAPDGRILDANPAACALLGRSQEEFCALGGAAVLAADAGILAEAMAERARTGKVRREMTYLRKDGSPVAVEMSSVLVKVGKTRHSLIFLHDRS